MKQTTKKKEKTILEVKNIQARLDVSKTSKQLLGRQKRWGLRVPTCLEQGRAWPALHSNFTMPQNTQDNGSHRGLLHSEVRAWNTLLISPPRSFTKAFNTTVSKHLHTYGFILKSLVRLVLVFSKQRMKSKKSNDLNTINLWQKLGIFLTITLPFPSNEL